MCNIKFSFQVFGGSWGSTLALAYCTSHPEKVNKSMFVLYKLLGFEREGIFNSEMLQINFSLCPAGFLEGHWNCTSRNISSA